MDMMNEKERANTADTCTNAEGCRADEHGPDTCPGAAMGNFVDDREAIHPADERYHRPVQNGSTP